MKAVLRSHRPRVIPSANGTSVSPSLVYYVRTPCHTDPTKWGSVSPKFISPDMNFIARKGNIICVSTNIIIRQRRIISLCFVHNIIDCQRQSTSPKLVPEPSINWGKKTRHFVIQSLSSKSIFEGSQMASVRISAQSIIKPQKMRNPPKAKKVEKK